jgi:hypothetical protein
LAYAIKTVTKFYSTANATVLHAERYIRSSIGEHLEVLVDKTKLVRTRPNAQGEDLD